MNTTPDSDLTPAERVDDIPRILRALRAAVHEALRKHKLAGAPVAIWRNGRVVWIPADRIPMVPDGAVLRTEQTTQPGDDGR